MHFNKTNRYILTCGDINGIGPEIIIKALNRIAIKSNDYFTILCPGNAFYNAAKIVKPRFKFSDYKKDIDHLRYNILLVDIGNYKQTIGKPTKASGEAAFESIRTALMLCKVCYAGAVITAPISKTAIQMAGHDFPGHTEMFADWFKVKNYVMMFLSKKMNAALATIHEPIKKIPGLLTKKNISDRLDVVITSLKMDLKIPSPKIAVLGLNPHAGEKGLIGKEEINTIIPVIKDKKFSKYLSGPFSPDAFFANQMYKKFDLVFGMYHDQVLIPFKLMNFGAGVNFTAGLPIVRTSPDHGTAFDIAGKGIADESSFVAAFLYAKKILNNRKVNASGKGK